jgi:hypothetical protein
MTAPKPKIVQCPVCGTQVPWVEQSKWRPFCSQRCQTIDLGDWAAERHRIGGSTSDSGSDEDDARGTNSPKH